MNQITLRQPPTIVCGNGCAPQCADWFVQRRIRRVLLVTSRSVRAQLQPVVEALDRAQVAFCEMSFVPPEPTVAFFQTALAKARAGQADAVLGIGGGSVLDVAKLLAAMIHSPDEVGQFFGINLLRARALPLVCLPTTAGTGAEVSPNAILLDDTAQLKKGVISPHLVPDAAFLDPLLSLSVPPAITAATGLDALTHCIEAYANLFAHPVVDVYALQGIRLIAANLLRAVRQGDDVAARAALALGSLYGGLCLGPVNTAAVHALAYPLGGRFHLGHGVSNALLLPHVLRFNLSAAPERYAEIALALGVTGSGSALATAERGVECVARLVHECAIPQTLSAFAIPSAAIPSLAHSAMQVTRLLKNNPRPLTEADAVAIYTAAY